MKKSDLLWEKCLESRTKTKVEVQLHTKYPLTRTCTVLLGVHSQY